MLKIKGGQFPLQIAGPGRKVRAGINRVRGTGCGPIRWADGHCPVFGKKIDLRFHQVAKFAIDKANGNSEVCSSYV